MNEHKDKRNDFERALHAGNISKQRGKLHTLQMNLGKKCNQSCIHCHVGAGPERLESMDKRTIDRILELLAKNRSIDTVDITGGAPELNPYFCYLIEKLQTLGIQIMDRCNLTVLFENGLEQLPEVLAQNRVRIIASLPCYLEENVDMQRGDNVYLKSIEALKRLNRLGYGKENSGMVLDLVYNPSGPFLPPEQISLEQDYKEHLGQLGIEFNSLITITNMPINRYAELLEKKDEYDSYCGLLKNEFNAKAAERIMCRELLSISWDGRIYDCDFNQAVSLPVKGAKSIWDIDQFEDIDREISFGGHCFGCTAGSGSSCKGKLVIR